jgi:hypothetical protein
MPRGGDEPLAISPPKAKVARSNRVGSSNVFNMLEASDPVGEEQYRIATKKRSRAPNQEHLYRTVRDLAPAPSPTRKPRQGRQGELLFPEKSDIHDRNSRATPSPKKCSNPRLGTVSLGKQERKTFRAGRKPGCRRATEVQASRDSRPGLRSTLRQILHCQTLVPSLKRFTLSLFSTRFPLGSV